MKDKLAKYMGKIWFRLLVIVIAALCFGVVTELVCNARFFMKSPKGKTELALENAEIKGFDRTENGLKKTSKIANALFICDQPYVNRLVFEYENDSNMEVVMRLYKTEEEFSQDIYYEMSDSNDRAISVSDNRIYGPLYAVRLIFTETVPDITVKSVRLENCFRFSWRRYLTFVLTAALALFLILFRSLIAEKVEYGFLAVATVSCLMMVFTFPTMKVSWDECYHFHESYQLGLFGEQLYTDDFATYTNDNWIWSLSYPTSMLEYDSQASYLNDVQIYGSDESGDYYMEKRDLKPVLRNIGHVPSAVGIDLAKLFHLPFPWVYMIGRLFNAIFYIAVTFFAIKLAKVGKRILTIIALMPTPIFLASAYSYDATLNALAFLALSVIFGEFYDKESKLSWKRFLIFLFGVGGACAIKMVYAPLFLLLLMLPKEKFYDKKTMVIMKYGVFLIGAVFVLVMVVPRLGANVAGDSRGGATSTSGQISFILHNPVFFVKLLVRSVTDTFGDRMLGNNIFGSLAHYDYLTFTAITGLPVVAVAMTDMPDKQVFSKRQKLFMGLVVLINIAIIWTALYISYTPVGDSVINGVQGRYFVPLLLPFLLLFSTDRIKNKISPLAYNMAVVIIPFIFTFRIIGFRVVNLCG